MINDIFSKEKNYKIKYKNKITIDNREKNSLVPAELIGMQHKICFKQLKVGDYIINNTIIERKEIKDFTQSIKNERLFKQLEEIKQFPNYILIIEGNIYTQKNLHPNSIRGTILSAATSYKIPIIFTQHPKETAQYISILANKKEKHKTITPTKKQFSTKSWQLNILQSFPNIGEKTAEELLHEFKTLRNIFTASKKTLKSTLGKRCEKIFEIINNKISP